MTIAEYLRSIDEDWAFILSDEKKGQLTLFSAEGFNEMMNKN